MRSLLSTEGRGRGEEHENKRAGIRNYPVGVRAQKATAKSARFGANFTQMYIFPALFRMKRSGVDALRHDFSKQARGSSTATENRAY
jgi:hypothetical protein